MINTSLGLVPEASINILNEILVFFLINELLVVFGLFSYLYFCSQFWRKGGIYIVGIIF